MKVTCLRSILLLGLLLAASTGNAQENRFKVSLLGGYEYFPNGEYDVKKNGYSVGAEFNYYPVRRLYLAASLHAGYTPGKTGKHTNTGDELTAPTHEYAGTLGIGFDLLSTRRHTLYVQAGGGVGYINEKQPQIDYDHKPEIHTYTTDNWNTRGVGLCAIGYDYRLTERLGIGVNYSAWLVPSRTRSAANVKLTVWL